MPDERPPDPRQDRVYVAILAVLVASVIAGAAVALAGDLVYHSEAMRRAGVGLAVVSGIVYLFFRILGRRAAGRRLRRRHGGSEEDERRD